MKYSIQVQSSSDAIAVTNLDDSGGDIASLNDTNRDYFEGQRERLLLEQAYETGYIRDVSRQLIVDQTGDATTDDVTALTLNNLNLRSIGAVQLCFRMRVVNLSGNFIADISPLASCPHLSKIDLSHNHISQFPYPDFWSSFINLQSLLLHDNGIGKLSCIQSLAMAPAIQFLTLYDTPLSLRPSYRHHTVNSIITLKVLDFHVVADEEVIEDAIFPLKFKSLSPNLSLPLSEMLSQTSPASCQNDASDDIREVSTMRRKSTRANMTIVEELECINEVVRRTNQIMAKFSPVILIQKTVRGFFARKFRRYLIDNRIWITKELLAAEDDQSQFREVSDEIDTSSIATKPSNEVELMEQQQEQQKQQQFSADSNKDESTSVKYKQSQHVRFQDYQQQHSKQQQAGSGTKEGKKTNNKKIPRDTLPANSSTTTLMGKELKGKKYGPGFSHQRDGSLVIPEAPLPTPKINAKKPLPEIASPDQTKHQFAPSAPSGPTSLPIDEKSLERLQFLLKNVNPEDVRPYLLNNMKKITDQAGEDVSKLEEGIDWLQIASGAHFISVGKRERELNKVGNSSTLSQVKDSKPTTDKASKLGQKAIFTDENKEEGADESEELKMSGYRVPLVKNEPLKEYLLRIMESVNDVRVQHEKYHKENDDKTVPKAPKYAFTTLDQLVYAKHKGVMSLATFLAVDKAYQAKEKEEQLQDRQDKVYDMRVQKKKAKQRQLMDSKQRAKQFSNLQDYDTTVTRAAIRERDDYYNHVRDKYRERGELREKQHSKKKEDFKFAQEFASHCSSIGNALRKHDLKVRREDRALIMSRRVRDMQDQRDEQRNVIRNYVAQRQKVLQAESNAERTEVELKIMQENKARREQVRDRVEELRRTKREVKELYPVPLHIHVGVQQNSENQGGLFNSGPNESLFSVYSTKGQNPNRPTRSPLTRLAERKILTNKSYDVIHQRVRSAGSNPGGATSGGIPSTTPAAVVHVNMH
ncbi:uncharacterized protein LOC142350603 [Convolutriloba macropyga]|uniref:uncharacterized protein LOC142350603 n=1 Tax=Convolutriloba macropyga TaxID=536237 RepID=UPI003F52597C